MVAVVVGVVRVREVFGRGSLERYRADEGDGCVGVEARLEGFGRFPPLVCVLFRRIDAGLDGMDVGGVAGTRKLVGRCDAVGVGAVLVLF